MDNGRFRDLETNGPHGRAKLFTSFRLSDDINFGGQHLDFVLVKNTRLCQFDGHIERSLAAKGWQEGVRPLFFDDLGYHFHGNGLDIGTIG